jgi:hypothetical protein
MKKFITSIVAATFVVLLFASCGSSKGCGLTADAPIIETTTSDNIIVAEAK